MIAHWQGVLQAQFGVSAKLQRLGGEYDLNFFANAKDAEYVLKVMHKGCDSGLVEMQCAVLGYLGEHLPDAPFPLVIPTRNGKLFCTAIDETGTPRLVWLQQRMKGACYADFTPKSVELIGQIGQQIGQMDKALQGFTHPHLRRDFKWNLPSGNWIARHLGAINIPERRALLQGIIANFNAILPTLSSLPNAAIHNDVNDYNILVSASGNDTATLTGLIDFGDMSTSPRIVELAIAGAYIVLDHPQPEAALAALVAGYHNAYPLTQTEVDLIWPLLQMRLAVSVVNATLEAATRPDDPYVTISQRPAWQFLESPVDSKLILAGLRVACGFGNPIRRHR
ncbi:MAG: phosphotransferase [Rhodobacteraceae bacterium]|nr:phosphotransferase [Paracoccaceae bacterium]